MRCNEVLFYSFQLENRTADYNRSWQVPAAFMLLHSQGSHAAVDHKGQCHRVGVIASALKRARQFAARKELQKQAKHEYLKQFYESADEVHPDHLVYQLKPDSPRLQAQQQKQVQYAQLNQKLAAQIPQLHSWQQLQDFLQQYSDSIHFLNVTTLAIQAQALQLQEHQAVPADDSYDGCSSTQWIVVKQLAALIIQHSSGFQPTHFATCAVAMACCRLTDNVFWNNFLLAAEHKVAAFSFSQLSHILVALAAAGFVPNLQWMERTYRQASKHIHAADAADVAGLMWAWGTLGYTPRDVLLMNQVKQTSRRAMSDQALSGRHLVALMHGLARMPKYAPNSGWLTLLTEQVQQHMEQLQPGEVVDLLLSLVVLGFKPSEPWVNQVLQRVAAAWPQAPDLAAFELIGNGNAGDSDSRAGSGTSRADSSTSDMLLAAALLLPPEDVRQLHLEAKAQTQRLSLPGSIPAAVDNYEDNEQLVPGLHDMLQLQQLFAEAALPASGAIAGESIAEGSEPQSFDNALSAQPDVLATATPAGSAAAGYNLLLQQQLSQHSPVDSLGVLCWCLSRLDFQPEPDLMHWLSLQLLHQVPHMSQEVCVDVVLGLVAIDYMPVGRLQQALLHRAEQLLPSMAPECLRRLCYALLQLQKGLEERAAAADSSSSSVSASRIFVDGCLQEYKQQHWRQLADAITHRQGVILWQSSTQQLADVLAFIAASNIKPSSDYLTTAVDRAVEKLPDGCPVPALCTLLWALARLGFKPHPQVLHQVLAALQRGLHLLSSYSLADAGWALCTLKHRPGVTWLELYMNEVASKASYMQAQALTDTLWALACFAAQPDREWLKRVVMSVGSKLADGQLSQQNAAVIIWALHQLGLQGHQLIPAEQTGHQQEANGLGADVEFAHAIQGLVQAVA